MVVHIYKFWYFGSCVVEALPDDGIIITLFLYRVTFPDVQAGTVQITAQVAVELTILV